MPELPEVNTMVVDLNKHIKDFVIKGINIAPKYKTQPDNDSFVKRVKGRRIKNVVRMAKYAVFDLDSDDFLIFHPAMTGRILLRDHKSHDDSWVRLVLLIERDGTTKTIKYADMRMFGRVFVLNKNDLDAFFESYGPEPIDESVTAKDFLEIIKSKNTNIKNILLDQKKVSGLGNIYANDALFIAKIHPETRTGDFELDMARRLLDASKQILTEGIKNRGSTLPDKMFVDIFGNEGSHQNHFRIYMKDKCPDCDTKVSYIKLNSRGTYFCPSCQI